MPHGGGDAEALVLAADFGGVPTIPTGSAGHTRPSPKNFELADLEPLDPAAHVTSVLAKVGIVGTTESSTRSCW